MRRRTVPAPHDAAGSVEKSAPSFDRWHEVLRHLGRFEGGLRARLLILFLGTVASFAIVTIGGASLARFVAPAAWALTTVAELVLVVGLASFIAKVGRETVTVRWGVFAVVAFLVSVAAGTAAVLPHFLGRDLGFMVGGYHVGAGWAPLVAHLALGIGLLASTKVVTRTASVLRAPVPLTHARSARRLLALGTCAVLATHLTHLFGTPSPEVTVGMIGVSLTLALVAGGRLAGSVRHLRASIDDALDAGQVGMPERWFAHAAYAR